MGVSGDAGVRWWRQRFSSCADRGNSSLIGVILLIGLLVIVVGIVGLAALNVAEEQSEVAPEAEITVTVGPGPGETYAGTDDKLEIAHGGGETVQVDQLNVTVGGHSATETLNMSTVDAEELTAGDTLVYEEDERDVIADGTQVTVAWDGGDESTVYAEVTAG